MKSTGIVRKLDKMGRIVLPKETRRLLNLVEEDSAVEIFIDDESIILKKYSPACFFCDSADEMIDFNGVKICRSCLEKMNKL